jgi:TonB family protein
MLRFRFLLAFIMLGTLAFARDHKPAPIPDHFEIGRRTFFDFGPPFDYYEIFLVRSTEKGTSVEKIFLTPNGNSCLSQATVEISSGVLQESVLELLGTNPCTIPEKALHRELKRCKHCLVFSGADVRMRTQCASGPRIIRSEVLDRDWFDEHPGTPKYTAHFMEVLKKLEQASGLGPMEQPVFPVSQPPKQAPPSGLMDELASGKYDDLFPDAPSKSSEIYRDSQKKLRFEPVQLVSISPLQPETYVEPVYPQLARVAHIEGTVVLNFAISPSGAVINAACSQGHPILCASAKDAASKWHFPPDASGRDATASLRYVWGCQTLDR